MIAMIAAVIVAVIVAAIVRASMAERCKLLSNLDKAKNVHSNVAVITIGAAHYALCAQYACVWCIKLPAVPHPTVPHPTVPHPTVPSQRITEGIKCSVTRRRGQIPRRLLCVPGCLLIRLPVGKGADLLGLQHRPHEHGGDETDSQSGIEAVRVALGDAERGKATQQQEQRQIAANLRAAAGAIRTIVVGPLSRLRGSCHS